MFITLEGGEGAGKSTLLHKLEKEFRNRGKTVVITREPGGSALGEQIRSWLLTHNTNLTISSKAEVLLFLAARAQHLAEIIEPALRSGKIVICDRFNDSTVAYQGVARGLGFDLVQHLCDIVCGEIVPDITFYLDIDPNIGLQRTRRTSKETSPAGELDRIENETIEFHQSVRKGLQEVAARNPNRVVTLDARKSPEQVFEEALKRLEPLLQV